jgi:hypothetical protein
MTEEIEWVTLYNPAQQAWHRVPKHPVVIQDFQDRGWETPEDSAARAEQDAALLHGKELEDALEAEGLSKGGTVAEKQARLAEKRAESATTTEETEGDQV